MLHLGEVASAISVDVSCSRQPHHSEVDGEADRHVM